LDLCRAIYVLGFASSAAYPLDESHYPAWEYRSTTGLVNKIDLEIQTPPSFLNGTFSRWCAWQKYVVKKHLRIHPRLMYSQKTETVNIRHLDQEREK
jgi:hypothetical protein